MTLQTRAIQIREVDCVATAVTELLPGVMVTITGASKGYELLVKERIPVGHKIALRDISQGDQIRKYGEVIGVATRPIGIGECVHVHNCRGTRARRFQGQAQNGERVLK